MKNNVSGIILNVVEIFKSIQGEGANTGKAAVFVRLANCNMSCWFCDTDWSQSHKMTVMEVLEEVKKLSNPNAYPDNLLIWTGGEPTLQLTDEILELFQDYYNCIETNGTNPVPKRIEYISCSPKVSPAELKKNFTRVNEFRYPIKVGDRLPDISELPKADNYFVSPIFLGEEKKRFQQIDENIIYSINYIKDNPQWRLSLQLHKLLNIP
ncbi:MAG: 7-carboxy-7-deazaguanine synthase QueE [Bacteroidota bacterium]|nr:7-carboxy-7-deazaguanine synthase QueE [Bacteroidota bacterium]